MNTELIQQTELLKRMIDKKDAKITELENKLEEQSTEYYYQFYKIKNFNQSILNEEL